MLDHLVRTYSTKILLMRVIRWFFFKIQEPRNRGGQVPPSLAHWLGMSTLYNKEEGGGGPLVYKLFRHGFMYCFGLEFFTYKNFFYDCCQSVSTYTGIQNKCFQLIFAGRYRLDLHPTKVRFIHEYKITFFYHIWLIESVVFYAVSAVP